MAEPCGDYSLKCRACQERFGKWQRHIAELVEEVGLLIHDHEIFEGVVNIMESAHAQKELVDGTFYEWLGSGYQEAVSLRIRRLLDKDKWDRTYSFRLLLRDIAADPKVISRERYRALYSGTSFPDSARDTVFAELTGADVDWLRPEKVQADLDALVTAARRIVDFADKRFAHYDKVQPSAKPTWGEVSECIRLFESVAQTYQALLLGTAADAEIRFPVPTGWTHVFHRAWIPQ